MTQIQDALAQRLFDGVLAYQAASVSTEQLQAFLPPRDTVSLPWPRRFIEGVFDQWLAEKIKEAEGRGRGVANATISVNDLPVHLQSIGELTRELGSIGDVAAMEKTAAGVISGYPFEALEEALSRLSAKLEDKGKREAADMLSCSLGLRADWHSKRPKRLRAGVEFEHSLYVDSFVGYSYETCQRMHMLAQAIAVAEIDGGESGLAQVLREFAAALNDAREGLPSRSKFGSSRAQITVFKEKFKLLVAPELADAIFAFVALHGSEQLIEKVA